MWSKNAMLVLMSVLPEPSKVIFTSMSVSLVFRVIFDERMMGIILVSWNIKVLEMSCGV